MDVFGVASRRVLRGIKLRVPTDFPVRAVNHQVRVLAQQISSSAPQSSGSQWKDWGGLDPRAEVKESVLSPLLCKVVF